MAIRGRHTYVDLSSIPGDINKLEAQLEQDVHVRLLKANNSWEIWFVLKKSRCSTKRHRSAIATVG